MTAVLQSRDGYLWLGTRSGLARFDGERFTAYDASNTPELECPHVTSLFEGNDGALWIAHETGELTCYQAGKFRKVPIPASWRGGKIFGISADEKGVIWLLSQAGELVRVKDGLVIPAPPVRTTYLLALARFPNGSLWIQRDNEVSLLQHGQLKLVQFTEPPTNRYIQGIGASRDGALWIMTENRMRKWKDGTWADDLGSAPWGWSPAHTILETREGRLVVATADQGLYIGFPGEEFRKFSRTNGFSDNWVTSLCEDREGNLWAGTGNGGLAMLRTGNITTLNPPDEWQGRAILSVTTSADGALWVGTEGAGLYRFQDGGWTNFQNSAGIANHYVWSVKEDVRGRICAGTWGSGLFVGNGAQFEHPQEWLNSSLTVPALLNSDDGGLWVGTGVGLLRYREGRVDWLARHPQISSPDVRAVRAQSDGTLWFGMSGGGLGRIQDQTLQQFRRQDGLSSDFVQCLHLETDDTLWIGTFGGLNRFKDGRFAAITKRQGLPSDVICDMQDDGLGYFWISSHGGIVRVSKTELNRCADGDLNQLNWVTYGLSDGLPSLECSGGFQPASCKTGDGRLWFPTSKGLVAVDPKRVTTNSLAPPVVIERLMVDDRMVAESPLLESGLRIAPGRHRFEFQFTGLSFAAPEKVRFKYRLEGLEKYWVEVHSPRAAYYSYIPPGNYRFQVRACNNDGVWSDHSAMLSFAVLPAFWQTAWFRILGGILTAVAGGGVVWLDARRRMRRKLERLEHQQAVERERSRIAKDIHDDLGARLTRISLLCESVPAEEVAPPQAAEALNSIFTTTRELTQSMDEIVWAVNPRHDTLDSLASYLGKFAQDFLGSANVRCRLDMPLRLPNWPLDAEVRHNLFLAFQESLNNVIRHAAATEVRISLTASDTLLTIVVEDNGRGFAAENNPVAKDRPAGHNGLLNMHQRMAQLGGHCKITSTAGQGTSVEFNAVINPQEL